MRLAFLSPYLEDWDSVQFALAIHNFDIEAHTPHPPGYILYVLLGKIVYFFTKNDTSALTLLSTLTGSLAIFPLFYFSKKAFGETVAVLSCLLFIAAPISFVTSISPLTNMPGLFLFLVFVYFAYSENLKKLPLVSGFAGLILGVRFTELPSILSILTISFLKKLNLRKVLTGIGAFLFGTLIWIIPSVLDTGFSQFVESYAWIGNYVIGHDSIVNQNFMSRVYRIIYLLEVSFTLPFVILGGLSFLYIVLKRGILEEYKFKFLFVWFLSYLIPLIFIYNLEVPRYTLPLLPPLAIMISYTTLVLAKKHKVLATVLYAFIVIVSFRRGLAQATRISQFVPPTVGAAMYISQNFLSKDTTIISSFTYRHFQYYAPTFKNYSFGESSTPKKVDSRYLVIDYDGIKDKIDNISEYELIGQKNFEGPKDIFPRVNKANLYIYGKI